MERSGSLEQKYLYNSKELQEKVLIFHPPSKLIDQSFIIDSDMDNIAVIK